MANTNIATDIQPLLGKERVLRHPSANKQSKRPAFLVILAILALVAIAVAKNIFKPAANNTVLIVGAQKDLLPGTRLGYTSCHYLQIPKAYFNSNMMTSSEQVAGRVVKYFVPKGEPITSATLYSGHDTLSANFENHERAMTLSLDDDSLLDHSINPGDSVDILSTASKDGKKYTKTIGQNIKVLMSIPREALRSDALRSNEINHITLAVTPELSELLTEAKEVGKIQLVLRNRLTIKQLDLDGVSENDLLPANLVKKDSTLAASLMVPAEPNPDLLPAPPLPPPSFAGSMPTNTNQALGWVVDVFLGGKRESVSVPAQ